jgi:hypothetical protein
MISHRKIEPALKDLRMLDPAGNGPHIEQRFSGGLGRGRSFDHTAIISPLRPKRLDPNQGCSGIGINAFF